MGFSRNPVWSDNLALVKLEKKFNLRSCAQNCMAKVNLWTWHDVAVGFRASEQQNFVVQRVFLAVWQKTGAWKMRFLKINWRLFEGMKFLYSRLVDLNFFWTLRLTVLEHTWPSAHSWQAARCAGGHPDTSILTFVQCNAESHLKKFNDNAHKKHQKSATNHWCLNTMPVLRSFQVLTMVQMIILGTCEGADLANFFASSWCCVCLKIIWWLKRSLALVLLVGHHVATIWPTVFSVSYGILAAKACLAITVVVDYFFFSTTCWQLRITPQASAKSLALKVDASAFPCGGCLVR